MSSSKNLAPDSGTINNQSLEDQMLLLVAKLMEGGQEDEEICRTLDNVTRLLAEELSGNSSDTKISKTLHSLIDATGFEIVLSYLDMRQGNTIRGHAALTVSVYLKASKQNGAEYLSDFFKTRVGKGTYDDFISAFSVVASVFPIAPSVSADLFLSEGFVNSLGSLMKRKWKSEKVGQALLEMLNAACMDTACREAIRKYCLEWLEEIVAEQPHDLGNPEARLESASMDGGSAQQRMHSETVRYLAAVILAKLQAVPPTTRVPDEKIHPVSMGMEDLSDLFTKLLMGTEYESYQSSIEGLAYASLQPTIKEKLASDPIFLQNLCQVLNTSPAKSPIAYGGLSILSNLTSYLPKLSEEKKRMTQLKAYADASKISLDLDPLSDDEHALNRGLAVFDAGVMAVLVTHSQYGSTVSLSLVVSIVFSLAKNSKLRGKIAQQGGVRLLLHAYSVFPESETQPRRTTAHALAMILISTNPFLVFGGSTPHPLTSAIRPLLSLLSDDAAAERPDLLPVFESLLALTNLASTNDTARNPIIRLAWASIEELLLSNNVMVTRATVELICNLMQSPEGVAKFADGGKQASHRMHVLLALADAEDLATRRAAGGALAALSEWDTTVNAILEREKGCKIILGLCAEETEELRHRGVVSVLNIIRAPEKVGDWGRKKMIEEGAAEVLRECLRESKSQEVLQITAEALKELMGNLSATSLERANK